jgi:hypothetical protein
MSALVFRYHKSFIGVKAEKVHASGAIRLRMVCGKMFDAQGQIAPFYDFRVWASESVHFMGIVGDLAEMALISGRVMNSRGYFTTPTV